MNPFPSLLSNWTSFKLDVQVSFQTGRPGLLSLTVANWDCSLWAARTCDCSLCAEIISFTFSFHYFNDLNVLCKANVRHYFSDLNILCNLKANVRHALSLVPGTCSFLLLLFFISFFKFSHLPNVLLFFLFFFFSGLPWPSSGLACLSLQWSYEISPADRNATALAFCVTCWAKNSHKLSVQKLCRCPRDFHCSSNTSEPLI